MQPERMPKLPFPNLYHVESETDPTVLVAIDATVQDNIISWFDTTKERQMRIEEVTDSSPEHFAFRRPEEDGGHAYVLIPLTLAIYRSVVRGRLRNAPDFDDESSMAQAFQALKDQA